ncbi:ATP-binding cassette domain-containing protein [Phytohabitans sp. ZYX-F-186]|uniref:ATP-binding cassette domain-containing protein n=1 Tax=Phytohabitans maris TaxID=3071409 RepID=A0ABU0ZST2_9ACTN|nr:oligopeptide/dipeptide ABC transporter ATP-binding protein [Phytohabitans sp. ZYX-F-186]MDQ7910096.1 ATP-binding cassette domain-containing protein [Phytohabitans sp. ZYX-F-186]
MSELLRCEDLTVHYPIRAGLGRRGRSVVRAVDGVSLRLDAGRTTALVGESGCGKSSLARALLQLERHTRGTVLLDGRPVGTGVGIAEFRRSVQVVFQDPYASLDPRMSVGRSIEEPLRAFRLGDATARGRRVGEVLERVGLRASDARRYPHEFSGGQRQRIAIARALAPNPRLVVCDEAVSALDVSVQAQIVALLREVQAESGLAYLFVSHDLGIVRQVADTVAVMYLGRLVEHNGVEELYTSPRHPYTEALLSAVPVADPDVERSRERIILAGQIPSPARPPAGCRFHTRCPRVQPRCETEPPDLLPLPPSGTTACHFPLEPVTHKHTEEPHDG